MSDALAAEAWAVYQAAECLHDEATVRAFDAICLKLQRSGRIGFSIPNEGVEATQVGAASVLKKSDWIFPSYRDFGMALYHGVKPVEMMHNMFGNARDSARGRQMPVHFSFERPIKFVSISSPIARALIGKYAGDIAEVQAPGGVREYEIIDVRYV